MTMRGAVRCPRLKCRAPMDRLVGDDGEYFRCVDPDCRATMPVPEAIRQREQGMPMLPLFETEGDA